MEGRPGPSPSYADPAASPPPIVFVGGTGRSGTHVLAEMLGRHSRYADIPNECRFHVSPQGFPDLLEGSVTTAQFLRKLRRFWWYRISADGPLPALLPRFPMGRGVRGLHKFVPRDRFDAAVERFDGAGRQDLESACRSLFLDLLWPYAAERDKPGLVEMSTGVVAQAPTLLRLFPEARVIHIVRDGRDSGASKVVKRQKREHPRDAHQGIEWWLGRLSLAEQGIRRAPAGKVLNVSLDELAYGDREAAYAAVLGFLGIDDEQRTRRFFDRHVNAENASRGRWRQGLSEDQEERVNAEYERALERISADGYSTAPLLRAVYESDGPGDASESAPAVR